MCHTLLRLSSMAEVNIMDLLNNDIENCERVDLRKGRAGTMSTIITKKAAHIATLCDCLQASQQCPAGRQWRELRSVALW